MKNLQLEEAHQLLKNKKMHSREVQDMISQLKDTIGGEKDGLRVQVNSNDPYQKVLAQLEKPGHHHKKHKKH
jgi:hypothetical protein